MPAARHRPRSFSTGGAVLAIALLLSACSSAPDPVANSPEPTASVSSPATGSPTPTSTLSAEQHQAVEEATEAVRAYAQTYVDILADPTPTINDINHVAANPQLDIDLRNLQQQLGTADEIVFKSTGPITVVSAVPLEVNLNADPPAVALLACVDRTSVSGTEGGQPRTGRREELRYQVVKTDYLPEPGWAVSRILPPKGEVQPQPC